MREILFRGKRIDNGEWVYGDLIQLHNQRNFIINNKFGACIDDKGNFINTESPFVCEVIPETIGQHTGLTANGTKIFEGDIVSISDELKGIYTCVWEEHNFEYEFDNKTMSFSLACVHSNDIKVIGNIHDNPELLKEREQ